MLINRAHIYIFGIPNHHRLMPCTRFWGVKRLPAEKVLKDTVGWEQYINHIRMECGYVCFNDRAYLSQTLMDFPIISLACFSRHQFTENNRVDFTRFYASNVVFVDTLTFIAQSHLYLPWITPKILIFR